MIPWRYSREHSYVKWHGKIKMQSTRPDAIRVTKVMKALYITIARGRFGVIIVALVPTLEPFVIESPVVTRQLG